jgi:hypothetical protein
MAGRSNLFFKRDRHAPVGLAMTKNILWRIYEELKGSIFTDPFCE